MDRFDHNKLAEMVKNTGGVLRLVRTLKALGMTKSEQGVYNWMKGENSPNAKALAYLKAALGAKSYDDFYTAE